MTVRPWSLVGAEIQGRSHQKRDIPCQDKTYCLQRNRVKVIALADGAGSARMSQYGADGVTQRVSNFFANNFDDLLHSGLEQIRDSVAFQIEDMLSCLSQELQCEKKDLSSTFLMVAIKKTNFIAIHIGDGVIGAYHRSQLEVISAPQNGEYANLTWFTTSNDLSSVIRVYIGDASQYSGFILMSDGVEASLYDPRSNTLAEAVINIFYMNARIDSMRMKSMLKESLETVIASRTNDDCSIAVMSRSRFKNYSEYAKYKRKCAKRDRKTKAGDDFE